MKRRSDNIPLAGSKLVSWRRGKGWANELDITAHCVVFVHGFTSSGSYLEELAEYFDRLGYRSLIYEYESYMGIDRAAETLAYRLKYLAEPLAKFGYSIVAHSMGGLVTRYMLKHSPAEVPRPRCVSLLGTPNKGTLTRRNKRFLSMLIDYGEALGGRLHPLARLPTCRSARQLIGEDEEELIVTLNRADAEDVLGCPILSISGGNDFLEIGRRSLVPVRVKSRILQWLLDESPNDGLVPESSSNLTEVVKQISEGTLHLGDGSYPDWSSTNHTSLTVRQEVTQLLEGWLKESNTKFVEALPRAGSQDSSPTP